MIRNQFKNISILYNLLVYWFILHLFVQSCRSCATVPQQKHQTLTQFKQPKVEVVKLNGLNLNSSTTSTTTAPSVGDNQVNFDEQQEDVEPADEQQSSVRKERDIL